MFTIPVALWLQVEETSRDKTGPQMASDNVSEPRRRLNFTRVDHGSKWQPAGYRRSSVVSLLLMVCCTYTYGKAYAGRDRIETWDGTGLSCFLSYDLLQPDAVAKADPQFFLHVNVSEGDFARTSARSTWQYASMTQTPPKLELTPQGFHLFLRGNYPEHRPDRIPSCP